MSARPPMTCETCRELLVELACEELDAERAPTVREHALSCERCGPELSKLERVLTVSRQLPMLSPSPDVERRIMQAARDAIADRAKGPAREAASAPKSGLSEWFTRLGAWAMSPQVAMASVLLLVVGIGLYALPLGHEPDATALRETEEEASEPAASAPSATATAAPTEAEAAKRERAADDAEREKARGRAAPVPAESVYGAPAKPASPPERMASKQAPSKPKKSAGGAAYDALEDSFVASESAAPRREARAQAEGSADNVERARGFAPPPPAPAAEPMAKAAPASSTGGRAPAELAAPPAGAIGEAKGSSSQLSLGIAAAQRGDYGEAKQRLTPLAAQGSGAERSQATLWLARSYRAEGDCARALPYYRVLTQAISVARAVLEEAADCYERTGNAAQAAKLRARISTPASKTQ